MANRSTRIRKVFLRICALLFDRTQLLANYRTQSVRLMAQSITLTLGMYWENCLSAAQRRFTQACETLARVRKLSRNTPALQFNIATSGGQQVNVTK